MSKSMVERYEQLLRQDPTSSVFVELAKALLEKGAAARAIEVCEHGISNHPTSTVGRVLWGKALIHLGRPAEAMEQFDKAIAIEKDNPYAYNLIGEVLLQRGLYRSALPILRKAVALQPNDGRVKVWLEQAQQALAGGPAPVFADLVGLDKAAAEASAAGAKKEESTSEPRRTTVDEAGSAVAARLRAAALGGAAGKPVDAGPGATKGEGAKAVSGQGAEVVSGAEGGVGGASAQDGAAEASGAGTPGEASDAPRANGTATDGESLEDALPGAGAASSDGLAAETPRATGEAGDRGASDEGLSAGGTGESQSGSEGVEAGASQAPPNGAPAKTPPPSSGGLLGDLSLPEEPSPSELRASSSAATSRPSTGKRSLLDDIPEATDQAPQVAAKPSTKQDTEALAAAYEKELRAKLAQAAAQTSFLSRYGIKIAVGSVVVVVLAVAIIAFVKSRSDNGGRTLNETLDRASDLIVQDTRTSLDGALTQLDKAREMDESSGKAWALAAWAHALRFADHGMSPDDRRLALEALEKPGARDAAPGLALATNVLVADDRGRETARALLLASEDGGSEVHALAGSLLLSGKEKDEKKALEHFDRALKASPSNVRALVALGDYYLSSEDYAQALEMFGNARKKSPEHPAARLGMAEARLALDQDLDAALTDVAPLANDAKVPPALQARQQLVHGRVLSALGKADEARAVLSKGTQGPLAFDFQLALAATNRAAGKLDAAQAAYEAALKLQPKSEEAKEGLGRTLLDRDRERDALTRLEADGGKKVSLVRGAAYARLGDWKRARAELARTRVNDRYPPEALAWLALADAAEGNAAQAREVLEKSLQAAKRPRNDMRLALGTVYWRERAFDKAQTQFEEAQKDPRDYEASCSLGRLLLARGLPDMALKPLTLAVERNGSHGEARDALGRVLLALGRTPEALKQFETWQLDNPGSAGAHKGFALALYHSGRRKDADGAVSRAVKLTPEDAEAHRLRAAVLFAAGDGRGGFSELERANKLDPKDAETFCEIAHAFLRQGNTDGADAAFAAARREGPDATCGRVGELYVQLPSGGRPAARTLEDLASRAPAVWDKAFARATLARVLLATPGALKEARAAADEAVKLAPFDGRSHLALGLVALRQRDAVAKQELLKAVELEPTDGLARLALADVLVRESAELPRAVEEYENFLKLAGSSSEAARVKKALPALKRKAK